MVAQMTSRYIDSYVEKTRGDEEGKRERESERRGIQSFLPQRDGCFYGVSIGYPIWANRVGSLMCGVHIKKLNIISKLK